MRVKTDAKRKAIVEMASEVFNEMGFNGTSMDEIAARLGASKATLYGYFPSKDALFVAVSHVTAGRHIGPAFERLQREDDSHISEALKRFGERLIATLCAPEVVAARRSMIAEAGRSTVGCDFYKKGPGNGVALMAGRLKRAMEAGQLKSADAELASKQLFALLEAETLYPCLYGVIAGLTRARVKQIAARAVATFMTAYKP